MTAALSPTLAGWGRLPAPGTERPSEDLARVTRGAALTRGLGRSYGDSSLPARPDDAVASSRFADRILAFDPATGVIRAEAGFSLVELNRLFMPRGWFSPVTPGTKFVTLGGMVASDVHGKNHHVEGCFGAHVRALRMRLADDSVVECGPDREPELFDATVGGMGLTGHILEVEFTLQRIPTSFIHMESERVPTIDEFLAALGRALHPASCVTLGPAEAGWYATARLPRTRSELDWVLDLARDGVAAQPGWFYEFEDEAWLVLSLLTPPADFAEGTATLLRLAESG